MGEKCESERKGERLGGSTTGRVALFPTSYSTFGSFRGFIVSVENDCTFFFIFFRSPALLMEEELEIGVRLTERERKKWHAAARLAAALPSTEGKC